MLFSIFLSEYILSIVLLISGFQENKAVQIHIRTSCDSYCSPCRDTYPFTTNVSCIRCHVLWIVAQDIFPRYSFTVSRTEAATNNEAPITVLVRAALVSVLTAAHNCELLLFSHVRNFGSVISMHFGYYYCRSDCRERKTNLSLSAIAFEGHFLRLKHEEIFRVKLDAPMPPPMPPIMPPTTVPTPGKMAVPTAAPTDAPPQPPPMPAALDTIFSA